MIRCLSALFVATVLAACQRPPSEDLTIRVEALEARYHTQARQIKELQDEVAVLKGGKPSIDLVETPTEPQ